MADENKPEDQTPPEDDQVTDAPEATTEEPETEPESENENPEEGKVEDTENPDVVATDPEDSPEPEEEPGTEVDNPELVNNAMQAIDRAKAEREVAMRHAKIRVEEIERIQRKIIKQGVNRDLAEELQVVVDRDTLFAERGVAIESFTSFPSRTNQQLSLEVSDDVKNMLIGGGAVLAIGIVAKIIHMIYKFFQRTKVDKKAAEKESKKIEASIEIYEEMLKLIENGPQEVKDSYKDLIESFKDAKDLADGNLKGKWSQLLYQVFAGSGEDHSKIIGVIENLDRVEERVVKVYNIIGEIPVQVKHRKGEELKQYVEKIHKEVAGIATTETVNKEVQEVVEIASKVKGFKEDHAEISGDVLGFVEKNFKTWKKTINQLTDRAMKDKLQRLATPDKEAEITRKKKELTDVFSGEIEGIDSAAKTLINRQVNDVMEIYQDSMTVLIRSISVFTTIQNEWVAFQRAINAVYAANVGVIGKLFGAKNAENVANSSTISQLKELFNKRIDILDEIDNQD